VVLLNRPQPELALAGLKDIILALLLLHSLRLLGRVVAT